MARNKGTFNFAANFQVKMQEALDPRVVVSAKADLITKDTWPYDGDTIYLYNGLIVGVADEQAVYMLVDITKVTETDYSGWVRIDAGAAVQVEIVNSLDSDSTDKALSAAQGKALMNEITTVAGKLTGIYSYKGSKATYAELPTDAIAGDVWNVEEAYNNHPAGTNWAWTGSEWDALAGSIDLSSYYTSEQVDAAIKVEADRAAAEEARLAGLIETNAQNISKNAGDISTNAGNISSLSTQIGEINEALAGKIDAAEGYQLISDEKLALIDTNASDIEAVEGEIASLKAADNGLSGRIDTLEGLISGGEIDGSSLITVVGEHTAKISALESDNTTNKSDITNLKTADTQIIGRLDAIESLNTSQQTSIDSLNSDMTSVKSSVAANASNLTTLTSTVNDHSSSIAALEQSIEGLAVKSVKEGDLVLAADASGVLSTTMSLAYDSVNHKIQLKGINGALVSELDAAEFVKDGMIDSVSYNSDTKKITITWNTDAGKESTEIDMSNLVDTYTASNGLELSDNAFSVKIDATSSDALSVSAAGLKLSVTDSLKADLGVTTLTSSVEDHEERIAEIEDVLTWLEIN